MPKLPRTSGAAIVKALERLGSADEFIDAVWANEGMDVFLAGRAPNFQKFRMRDKRELDGYLRGLEKNLNAPPDMRRKGSKTELAAKTPRRQETQRNNRTAKSATKR